MHDLDRHREINGAHEALPFYWLLGSANALFTSGLAASGRSNQCCSDSAPGRQYGWLPLTNIKQTMPLLLEHRGQHLHVDCRHLHLR